MSKLRVLSLFAGIGGFDLGLERTGGFETVAFCEINSFCQRVLAKHWTEVSCYDDVCTLSADRLAADGHSIDVICGGFPCQDISFAGKGAGLAGERSGLWREYARLIGELKPRYIVVENVAALLSRGMGDVLRDMACLGYDAVWDRIRAFDVGAPHLRARIWIVAYARGLEHEGFGDALRRSIAAQLLETALANAGYGGHGANDLAGENPSAARTAQGAGSERQRVRPLAGRGRKVVADPTGERRGKARKLRPDQSSQWTAGGSENVADSTSFGRQPMVQSVVGRAEIERTASPLANSGNAGGWGWWSAEPNVGRVAHGVPARVDRLRSLGNAVVPQIPEIIGRAILAARETERLAA